MVVEREYDVSLTFAGTERAYAEEIATLLKARRVRVFYDAHATVHLWGHNLLDHLGKIYRERSKLCVLFASAEYARREWTAFERKAAQEKASSSAETYLLPLLFDETSMPDITSTTCAVDTRLVSPARVAEMIIEKLGRKPKAIGLRATVLAVVTQGQDPDLHKAFNRALERCEVNPDDVDRWSTHHGLVALVPEQRASVSCVLTDLVPTIESISRERATTSGPLRVGVHSGQVIKDRPGVDVTLAVDAARAAGVEELLAASKSRCAVVVSDRVFQTVVVKGRGGSNPAAYQRMRLPDGSEVHVRLHGYPKPPGDEPEPPQQPGKTYHFGPGIKIGQVGDVHLGSGNTFGDGYRFGSVDDR
ncbi:TIR domain-containing protein [Actinokineospora diospyrosa]|uniref:TIR domain-containing protein n=1 Tax=Actinokineospora diospyrosa TaxID=103728 RepID=A0ABT1IMZ3_9PSEU|nr:TIR domain-containing protein [Actinokineospora diospyrosa]MCP2273904.1 TIR domain-containing protein [Actinokineospora diospyrosa]